MSINLRAWLRRELAAALPRQAFTGAIPASQAEVLAGANAEKMVTPASAAALRHGGVRLTKSGGNLVLVRDLDGWIWINGIMAQIPAEGVSLAPTGTAGVLQYIYLHTPSAPALEASTQVPVLDSTGTVMVKTGDASRTLVGMAQPVTGPAWVDTEKQRLVASYHHRRQLPVFTAMAANKAVASLTDVELFAAGDRLEVLSWGVDPITLYGEAHLTAINGAAPYYINMYDLTVAALVAPDTMSGTPAYSFPMHIPTFGVEVLSQGFHQLTLRARSSSTTSSTFNAAYTRMSGHIRG
jgi:hypothetical protein